MSEKRIITEQHAREIFERVKALARGGGETGVSISSWWQGELRWARNRVSLASDRRDVSIRVTRKLEHRGWGVLSGNQIGDDALEAAVRAAERGAQANPGEEPMADPPEQLYTMPESAPVWSDATAEVTPMERGERAWSMIEPAEAAGLYSAGYLEMRAGSYTRLSTAYPELPPGRYTADRSPHLRWTQAQCSMTVRDASGMGSGWAGLSSYDLNRIDGDALAARAVQKCEASRNPVALEPGRYTVILEPQALADMMEMLFIHDMNRPDPEQKGKGPFVMGYDDALGMWRTKLGLKVVDERITITHEPMDPRLGIVMTPTDLPAPVTWIENGVLKNLDYAHEYAVNYGNLGPDRWHTLRTPRKSYRIHSGETSMEEMIRTTRRGLLVTRFSNVRGGTMLSTGLTRDGLWLIENGEITKAVRNFRFTESILFVLNNVEQIGEAVPVFRPTKNESGRLTPAVVPPIKARDFSFTSLVDAV